MIAFSIPLKVIGVMSSFYSDSLKKYEEAEEILLLRENTTSFIPHCSFADASFHSILPPEDTFPLTGSTISVCSFQNLGGLQLKTKQTQNATPQTFKFL